MADTELGNTPVLRERVCPICAGAAAEKWMEGNAALQSLDSFAFSSRKFPEYMHFRQMRCPRCDVVYASPAPDVGWLQSAYRTAAFDADVESAYAADTYADAVRGVVPALAGRNMALDIGAGDGAFLSRLKQLGFANVVGIEPSVEPVRRAAPSIADCLRNDFFRVEDFEAESYDMVTCFQTLEHVEEPLRLCQSARSLLVRGGAYVVVVHDFRAPLARLLGGRSPIYDIEHLQLFSIHSLERLLSTAGFVDVSVRRLRNAYPLHYWLRLLPLPASVKRGLCHSARLSRVGQWVLSARVGNLIAIGFRR